MLGGFISDGPIHLRSETIRVVSKALQVPHHFTLPYCVWCNGAVKRLAWEVLRAGRALFS